MNRLILYFGAGAMIIIGIISHIETFAASGLTLMWIAFSVKEKGA